MKTLWMSVNDLTGPPVGTLRFRIGNGEVERLCDVCDIAFPQTDKGWQDQQKHEFEAHERPMRYDWSEIDGKRLTIQVIRRHDDSERGWLYPEGQDQTELVAVADDGTVYCLPFSYYDHDEHGFKFKPRARTSRLLGTGRA